MLGNTEGLLGPGADLFDIVERKFKIYQQKLVATPSTSWTIPMDNVEQQPITSGNSNSRWLPETTLCA